VYEDHLQPADYCPMPGSQSPDVGSWPIASFGRAANLAAVGGTADSSNGLRGRCMGSRPLAHNDLSAFRRSVHK
jgi:hypothetical protein